METKPVVVGPLTFLKLANNPGGLPLDALLDRLLPLYAQVLAELAEAGVAWVQMDEPVLVADPSAGRPGAARPRLRRRSPPGRPPT